MIEEMRTSLDILNKTAAKFKAFKRYFIEQGGKSVSRISGRHSRQQSLDSSRMPSKASTSQRMQVADKRETNFNSPIKKEEVDVSHRKQSDMMIRLQKSNLNIYEKFPAKPTHRRVSSGNAQYLSKENDMFNTDGILQPPQEFDKLAPNSGKYVRYQNSVKLHTERLRLNPNVSLIEDSFTSRRYRNNLSHVDPAPTQIGVQENSTTLGKSKNSFDISAFNPISELPPDKHLRRELADGTNDALHPITSFEQYSSPRLEESTWNAYYKKHIKNSSKILTSNFLKPNQFKKRRQEKSSIDHENSKTSLTLNHFSSGSISTPKNSKLFFSKRKREVRVVETDMPYPL